MKTTLAISRDLRLAKSSALLSIQANDYQSAYHILNKVQTPSYDISFMKGKILYSLQDFPSCHKLCKELIGKIAMICALKFFCIISPSHVLIVRHLCFLTMITLLKA